MTEEEKIFAGADKKIGELQSAERFIEIVIAAAFAVYLITENIDIMIVGIAFLMLDMICEILIIMVDYLAERKVKKIMTDLNRQVEKVVFNYSDNYLAEELYEFESEYGFLHK